MPYAEPTSPVPSPTEKHAFRKRYLTPPTHFEQVEAGPSSLTGPMPGIPRRSSSNQSGSPTSRRMMSPAVSRQSSSTYQSFPSSRPMEGMPRRPSADKPLQGLTGLPSGSSGGNLGLHLHPSPTKALTQRDAQDIPSSTSTVDSPLPSTPADEPHDLPLGRTAHHEDIRSDPFQSFESPHKPSFSHPPHRSALSPPRPPFLSRRSSSQGHHRGNETTGSLPMKFSSSASATHLPNANHHRVISSQPVRPTASMIRKKSGEIVKPSLKARSMSTPDLFRQGDGSEPTTPEDERERGFPEERSKSVRFAGEEEDDGAALESVVLFLREQKPIAVGKAADPEQAALLTETETEIDTDASDFVQFRTRRNAAARAADEAERIVLEGGSRVPRLRVDFAPDARGSLLNEHVVLERAELVNGIGPLSLRGSVIVRNISFQKSVAVRFTLDHWQTVSEVSGNHVCHIPPATTGDEGWDRFGFSIKLEDYKRKLDERKLLTCIRYTANGREWWDSNDGENYTFTFSTSAPKRATKPSGPAAFGGGFMRLNDAASSSLPGIRHNRSVSPASKINNAFGVSDASRATGPRSWVFPKLAAHLSEVSSRSASPVPSAPPSSFIAPALPDVHTHLSLSRYCAPSPPQSPPNQQSLDVPIFGQPPLVLATSHGPSQVSQDPMSVVGGQNATLSPPISDIVHDRRSSWSGETGGWDSFSAVMQKVDSSVTSASTDGESTPVAAGSRSPAVGPGSSQDSSPETRPISFKRSTGDLRALMTDDAGLITPPSSNLSSPPSPGMHNLPAEPMSPSPSPASTGESSPVRTISSDSTPDLSNIAVDVDPEERGRNTTPNSYKMLSNSYQEFVDPHRLHVILADAAQLDKFCFFQSPAVTPVEEPVYSRPSFLPGMSGHVSPSAYPFYSTTSSNSPRKTATPAQQYDSFQDAFGFPPVAMGNTANTPKASPPPFNDPRAWISQHSPSLAAK